MKAIILTLVTIILITVSIQQAQSATKEMTVEFPNPSRTGTLIIVSGEGNINITGYNGKEVVINANASDNDTFEENEKAKGMKRVSGGRFNVSTNQDDNAIVITRPMSDDIDLNIKVPADTKLSIGGKVNTAQAGTQNAIQEIVMQSIQMAFQTGNGGFFNGNIEVSGVKGEMELNTLDGDITLSSVSGSALVNTIDGDITVAFTRTTGDKPMSFSTIDGDIDVTFPAIIKATISASHLDGDVYTDFDMEMTQEVQHDRKEKVKRKEKAERIEKAEVTTNQQVTRTITTGVNPQQPFTGMLGMMSNSVTGKINGGGRAIMMKTIDGDIFIRKAK